MQAPSNERPIPLSAREDIHAHRAKYLGQTCWVIKDPVKLSYYRLEPIQYETLLLLNGEQSISQICQKLKARFPTQRQTHLEIQKSILDLYQKGLAWSTRPGQAESMLHRRDEQKWTKLKQTFKNVLFIRLPGFDPTKIIQSSYWIAKLAFHPAVMIWAMAIIVYSWLFMLTHATEMSERLPSLESLVSVESSISLWLIIGVTKIIHELGHAFACRHSNGECHEIGMAFLVFSPCLYCDVSDSWTLRSKWHRIGIALAGVYVELTIASLAFFGWWGSAPGAFHDVCFLVFVVSSISTLLFNLNPLLRLDGYYVLSDLLEIPNLRQKADQALEDNFVRHGLGLKVDSQPLPRKTKSFFLTYAICAAIYRTFLVAAICCILYAALKPFRLEFLGLLVGAMSLVIGSTSWFNRIRKSSKRHASQGSNVRNLRPYFTGVVALAAVFTIFFVPLPFTIKVPLELEYANQQKIYANADGQLAAIHVTPGQSVRAGQMLIQLASFETAERQLELHSQKLIQEVEVRKQAVMVEPEKAAIERETLKSLESELQNQTEQIKGMSFQSPIDGRVVEAPVTPPGLQTKRELPSWHGTPIDGENLGCYLGRGTHLMTIAPKQEFQAVLRIDQFDAHSMKIGQPVRIKLAHLPNETLNGSIAQISSATTKASSRTAGPRSSNSGTEYYQATVSFEGNHEALMQGLQGVAKVKTESQTTAQWIWRHVKNTFKFQI